MPAGARRGIVRTADLPDEPDTTTGTAATGVRTGPLCFASRGFSLHAATRIAGPDRRGLERLCGYVARPPLASGRLRLLASQRLCFALKTPWSDGTRHLLLSRMELLEKLAALVPPPRFHLLRYPGVLAPRARDRGRIVPAKPVEESTAADRASSAPPCAESRTAECALKYQVDS